MILALKKDIKKEIDNLENLLNKEEPYIQIKKFVSKFTWMLPSTTIKFDCIFRVRIADIDSEDMNDGKYKKFEEIHHRTDLKNIKKFGRFNEPYQSVFYASSSQELAYSEVSENYRLNKKTKHQTVTRSEWELNEEIIAVIIVCPTTNYGENILYRKNQEILLNSNLEEYYNLFSYLAEKTIKPGKSEKDYYLTAAFANTIFDTKFNNRPIDCIIYPSGLHSDMVINMSAMNFCFHPRVIEEGKLILRDVLCHRVETTKIGDKTNFLSVDWCKPKRINHKNKSIIWD